MRTITFKRKTNYSYRSTCQHRIYLCVKQLRLVLKGLFGVELTDTMHFTIHKQPTDDSIAVRLIEDPRSLAVGKNRWPHIIIDDRPPVEVDVSFQRAWLGMRFPKTKAINVEVWTDA